jgi:hypothetical protein
MIYKNVSFKTILNKLYRDLNLTTEINEAHVVEWCAEVLAKIGAYAQYEQNMTVLQLSDGKAELPCNFDKLVYLTCGNKPLHWSNNSQIHDYMADCPECKQPTCCTDYAFYIQGTKLITDIKDTEPITKVCLTYLGTPVDDEGYPMIPDDVYFAEACAKYVTYMLDYREWRKGNVPDKVLQKSEQDYLFYINSARGSANMPNERQLRNLKNIWVRLMPNMNDENRFFRKIDQQERRYNK